VFDRLDGFSEVDIRLTNLRAGPFLTRSFALTRGDGDGLYRLALSAEASPRALAGYAASQVGGGLGPLISGFANNLLSLSDVPIPVQLDAGIESNDGRPRLVTGGGSVAGVSTGPLAEALAAAVIAEL